MGKKKQVCPQEISEWLNQEFAKNNMSFEKLSSSLNEKLEASLGNQLILSYLKIY